MMMEIVVRPVRTPKERHIFLTFPWRIYKDDTLWVPPLMGERAKTTDPEQGSFFKRGAAEFFIAWRGKQPVGTIMAAEDPPTNAERGTKECMFGFFDCINNYAVAEALFDTAAGWGQARGLNALFGPFNLDYEDSYAILVEGRDRPPALMCGHTPEYYVDLVTRYGFEPARPQNVALALDLVQDTPQYERLRRIAERVRARGHIIVRTANFEDWDAELDRVHYLLNHSLGYLGDAIPWHRDALESMLEPFKQIADPDLILFADIGERTVGFFPGVPNLNEALIHVNGLRYPWNYLQLLWHMRRQSQCLAVKSVLVLPEYWNRGVAVLLFDEMRKRAVAKGYIWADLSITSIDNPNTIIMADHLGAKIYKRWQVYRKYL
jgi:GNAT superfamily N-acetyltransferase